jgi:hypothetical protein
VPPLVSLSIHSAAPAESSDPACGGGAALRAGHVALRRRAVRPSDGQTGAAAGFAERPRRLVVHPGVVGESSEMRPRASPYGQSAGATAARLRRGPGQIRYPGVALASFVAAPARTPVSSDGFAACR